ncbi:hypothetical protein EKG39_16180 [Shewanella atlantica]|uniref:OmpR/PhoB-type domain-containing protein n=2 Tax=Shewanella atlantica TaxID=271099 RepID=A0A3S0KG73_9GAMM|nr:hypothetical protein EKG39_16180 [Shewanella atlantica]
MISLPYQKYQLGECVINCHDMTISVGDKSVQLPAKVFEFLKLLILHAGQTVTKEQAIDEVWLGNIEVGKRGTGNAIWQLRKSLTELGIEPETYFKTITKVGYQLLITPSCIEETPDIQLRSNTKNSKTHNRYTPFLLAGIIFTLISVMFAVIELTHDSAQSNTEKLATRITNFEGVEEQAAISPDGRYMAFQWRREKRKGQLYIKDLSDQDAPLRQITMTSDRETSPTWSPDGLSLAYFRFNESGECSVHVRELITNRDNKIDTGCMSIGYLHSLEWSPDGQRLAYAKSQEDRVSVVTYRFESAGISPFTFPAAGEEDLLMSWSADSKQLVFVRSVEMKAKVFVKSLTQDAQLLVDGETMVIGLEWDQQANQIYFNALRDGSFVIEIFDMGSKKLMDFHHDDTISSLALNYGTQELYYSRHIAQEHITIRSLTDGQVHRQLASSSRDMFGQAVMSTGDILFLSNRSGTWELWLKQETDSKQLTREQGLVSIPAVSPVNNQFAIAMKPAQSLNYELFLGRLPGGKLMSLKGIDGDIRNPSFSRDGTQLYFSSNMAGKWGIYRYTLASEKVEAVVEDGKYAIEDQHGGLYYSKDNLAGIFYLPADEARESLVTDELAAGDWGSFFYHNSELYFLKRTVNEDIVVRIDAEGGEHVAFSLPALSIRNERALAIATEDRVVVSMLGINDADIYSVSLKHKI